MLVWFNWVKLEMYMTLNGRYILQRSSILRGKVNRRNVKVWGTDHLQAVVEHNTEIPKGKRLLHNRVINPTVFSEKTAKVTIYLIYSRVMSIHIYRNCSLNLQ
jgi:hypothetical protein